MAIIAPFIPLSKQPRPQARERSDGVSVSCNLAHHIRWFCSPKLRQETSLQLPISRQTGHVEASTHFGGNRVYQDLS